MKAIFTYPSHQVQSVFSCFPETEFEKRLFGCDYIVISKQEHEGKPYFVFWFETPDLSHLKRGDDVPEPFNPYDAVDLPEEFREELQKELRGCDGMEGVTWNDLSKKWEER
jgi:hypothetical protein